MAVLYGLVGGVLALSMSNPPPPPPFPVLSNIHFLSATLSFALDLAKFLGTSSIDHLLEKLQGAPNSRLWFALPPPVTSFLQKSKAGGR